MGWLVTERSYFTVQYHVRAHLRGTYVVEG